jgi:hypothetical protein
VEEHLRQLSAANPPKFVASAYAEKHVPDGIAGSLLEIVKRIHSVALVSEKPWNGVGSEEMFPPVQILRLLRIVQGVRMRCGRSGGCEPSAGVRRVYALYRS